MNLRNQRELDNTQEKLRGLETLYEASKSDASGDIDLRRAEMASLKRLINQLTEEIARYEAHQPVRP